MLRIEGVIKLLTPMCVAEPAKYRYSEGRILSGAQDVGSPLTRTVRYRLVGQEATADTDKWHPDMNTLPYFPANDLRGRLRRKACGVIFDHLRDNAQTLSLDAYNGLSCGSSSGNPATGSKPLDYIRKGSEHLFMGPFGGGPYILRSGLVTHDMIPICERTIHAGTVPEALRGSATSGNSLRDFTYVVNLIKRNEALMFDDPRAEKIITDYRTSITDLQETLFNEKTARKAAKESKQPTNDVEKVKRSQVAMMYAIEVVAPGTALYFRVGLSDRLNDAQSGLMLEALTRLCNDQAIGGYTRNGMGCFTPMLSVFDGDTVTNLFRPVTGNTQRYELDMDAEPIARRIDAMTKALGDVTAEGIEWFFKGAA
jgi:CRISPR type IV-associated protein Csf2